MTTTDQIFEADKPAYYVYSAERKERCLHCGKIFETRLEFNRFCSPSHKEKTLRELTGRKS